MSKLALNSCVAPRFCEHMRAHAHTRAQCFSKPTCIRKSFDLYCERPCLSFQGTWWVGRIVGRHWRTRGPWMPLLPHKCTMLLSGYVPTENLSSLQHYHLFHAWKPTGVKSTAIIIFNIASVLIEWELRGKLQAITCTNCSEEEPLFVGINQVAKCILAVYVKQHYH